jgi:glycosyltransferase involved in cell wall biosynthesis
MKIAYLSRGKNVYDRRFLNKMLERNHKVYFISYYPCEHINVEGVETYFYDYTSMHRFNRFLSLQTALHLRRLLKRIKPDVLHTGWIQYHGFFGALSDFHPILSMPWGSDILIKPELSPSLRRITRFTLRRADMITCDCEVVKNKIIQISGCSPDKIVTFPWGIDLQTFRPNETGFMVRERLGWGRNKILIMTRSMDKPLYGHDTFIEALPSVIHAEPETRVIFVGRGRLEQEIRLRIAELGLKEYVYFTGWLEQSFLAEYLNAADVYVSSAISDGTSCSLLEAMACRLPVIVTDALANLEWVENGTNGYIVPRKDEKRLAEALVALIENPQLRKEMGARNLQIARKRADWEKNFSTLEDIYKKLVAAY